MTSINDLHQLPESHPIAQRERISLAHVDVAGHLRRNRERLEAGKAASDTRQAEAAGQFTVGQSVRTTRRMGADFLTGTIVSIDSGKITLDNGRKFVATALTAA